MNGGLGWIRGLKGHELARLGMGTIFLVVEMNNTGVSSHF